MLRFPNLLPRYLKQKIFRKTLLISFHLLVEPFGGNAVKSRQIRVQDHLLTADFTDERFYLLERKRLSICPFEDVLRASASHGTSREA